MFLYLVIHNSSGKCYVGNTTNDIESRWIKHKSDARNAHGTYFTRAIRKYGPEAFSWNVIETHNSHKELLEAEIFMIAYLRGIGADLYNLTDGGEGTAGIKVSQETREKLRAAKLGKPRKPFSDQARHNMSLAALGRLHTPETRAKMSLSRRSYVNKLDRQFR